MWLAGNKKVTVSKYSRIGLREILQLTRQWFEYIKFIELGFSQIKAQVSPLELTIALNSNLISTRELYMFSPASVKLIFDAFRLYTNIHTTTTTTTHTHVSKHVNSDKQSNTTNNIPITKMDLHISFCDFGSAARIIQVQTKYKRAVRAYS